MINNEFIKGRTVFKVLITKEADFDCERIGVCLDKGDIKEQFESYLYLSQPVYGYFKGLYYDEKGEIKLMCFFRRGELFGNMRIWRLVGICLESDYSSDLEERGLIRNWLDSYLPEED